MNHFSLKNWGLDARKYRNHEHVISAALGISFFLLAFLTFAWIDVLRFIDFLHHQHMPSYNPRLLFTILYFLVVILGLLIAQHLRATHSTGNLYCLVIALATFFGTLFSVMVDFLIQLFFAKIYIDVTGYDFAKYMQGFWSEFWPQYLIVILILSLTLLLRWRMRGYRFNVQRDSQDTSMNLGSARMASEDDITRYGLRAKQGALIGKDRKGYIRFPELTDRLILAYRGRGKTSSILVPFLIDYVHVNKLITDVKGELAAITARKAKAKGREVFIIDPFNV